MAIALDSSAALVGTFGAGTSVSVAFNNVAGTYLVVTLATNSSPTHAPFSATYNGVAMTRVLDTANASGVSDAVIFILALPATGSNTVSITWDAVSINRAAAAYSFTGVDSVDVSGGVIVGPAGLMQVDLTTGFANEMMVNVGYNNNANAMTEGAGQTNVFKSNSATGTWATSLKTAPTAGVNSQSYTATSFSQPAMSAISLKATAASSPAQPLRMRMGVGV